jgi:hypothetical protein
MTANVIRGEVDIDLAGMTFTLRPSYEAVVACEEQVGLSLTEMAVEADKGSLHINQLAIIVVELVRAWGKETGSKPAQGLSTKKVGALIFTNGVMTVSPRVAIVLSQAAAGGVDASGKEKPIQELIQPSIGENSPGSQQPPSGGQPANSGRRPRTSSGRRSKPGGK